MKTSSTYMIVLALSCTVMHHDVAAQPVTWNLTFHDEANTDVGNGEFSYDPSTTACIETIPLECVPGMDGAFEVTTEVTSSISFIVAGIDWGMGPGVGPAGLIWWDDAAAGVGPGIQFGGRAGPNVQFDRWLFWDDELTQFQVFEMDTFAVQSATKWGGDYSYQISAGGGPITDFGQGTWEATLVPEPTSLVMAVWFLGCLGIRRSFRRPRE